MPRFFFSAHGGRSEFDTEGTELTDCDAARLLAFRLTGEILKDETHRVPLGDIWRMEVSDEASKLVCCIEVKVSATSAE